MTTARDIVMMSLRVSGIIGVGQDPLAEDTNTAFTMLNMMIAQWARKRWVIWHLKDVSKVSTGAQSYTVGTGGDFNTPRPDKIEGAYFRQLTGYPNQVDFPLELIEAREDYSRISLKTLASFGQYVFYDSAYPLGSLYVWPIPSASIYEIHILVKEPLVAFADLDTAVAFPPEYEEPLYWNLAMRLRPAYQMPADPQVLMAAKASLNTIRVANSQIGRLTMPKALQRGVNYNIHSDRVT